MTAPTPTTTTGTPSGERGASDAATGGVAPAHTGSPASRVLGGLALGSVVLLVLYGLVWSPADAEMADSVRLMYIHVPAASFLYTGCFITTVASAMWLRRRTPGWDALVERAVGSTSSRRSAR